MLSLFNLSVILCVVLQGLQASDHVWKQFKAVHGKDYHPHDEAQKRVNFEEKLKMIADHNIKADLGLVSYKIGLNAFSDMTNEEFVRTMTGRGSGNASAALNSISLHQVRKDNLKLPASVNWVNEGVVTNVKNQGQCGSCWSFATAGAAEGAFAMKTGKLESVSNQQVLDCSRSVNMGCNGGFSFHGLQWIVDNRGVVADKCYAYKTKQETCRSSTSSCLTATLTGVRRVASGDENALKDALSRVGPISVAMDAGRPGYQNYRSGIYKERICNTASSQLNHEVLLVGYGTEAGEEYWLIKNSYGATWGEKGYFRIAMKGNVCGIASDPVYAIA